jgi:hypothetical protein
MPQERKVPDHCTRWAPDTRLWGAEDARKGKEPREQRRAELPGSPTRGMKSSLQDHPNPPLEPARVIADDPSFALFLFFRQ